MEVRAEYTESLVRRVATQYWARSVGPGGFISAALGAVAVAYLAATGDTSWYVGALGAVVILGAAVFAYALFVFQRRGVALVRRMSEPATVFTFSEGGIDHRNELGAGTTSWDAITGLLRLAEAWLLQVGQGQYVTIPTAASNDEARSLILEQVQLHGGTFR